VPYVCAVKSQSPERLRCVVIEMIQTIWRQKVGVSITLFRRSYQTTQSCKSCKAAVVNDLGKGGPPSGMDLRDECK
jgi:hypothetical protein